MAIKKRVSSAVPEASKQPPPSITIRGKQAKRIQGSVGSVISITIRGRVAEAGINEYSREPHARIEVARITNNRKPRGK